MGDDTNQKSNQKETTEKPPKTSATPKRGVLTKNTDINNENKNKQETKNIFTKNKENVKDEPNKTEQKSKTTPQSLKMSTKRKRGMLEESADIDNIIEDESDQNTRRKSKRAKVD